VVNGTTASSETQLCWDGRFAMHAYASNLPPYSEMRIWVFGANRSKLGELPVTPSLSGPWPTLAFSGDGTRIVSNAQINFQDGIKILAAP